MPGIMDRVRKKVTDVSPLGPAARALDSANKRADDAALQRYKDTYGPSAGERMYREDQRKAAAKRSKK